MILQHGSILIDVDYEKMCSLFNINSPEFLINTKQRVTSINNELKTKISYVNLAKALKEGFSKVPSL